jgi:endonuclease/exonuclease/phosphatase family metal-dependent hydrolase
MSRKGTKIAKHVFQYFVVTANILAALLLVASAYSDRVPPETSMTFSYLGLIFPFICLLNLLFFIYWLFMRKGVFMLIGLVTLVLCWNPVSSYFPVHFQTPVPEENVIKVLTYNVMSFAYTDHTKEKPNKIVQYIAESGADIVCMQEYLVFARGENRLTAKKLDKALSMYPYSSVVKQKTLEYGVAVYSKYPIITSRKIKYPSKYNGSAIFSLDVNGKTLTLINNHLESFKLTMEDKGRYSDFVTGAGLETFDGLRGTIQQKLGPAFLIRAKQARVVADEISNNKSDYLLVCGDFNDTPISYAHRKIQGSLLDAFAETGNGPGTTYNQNYFWFRIDKILHSANMEAYNCTVDKVKYSDHYPVWCYLRLN